MVMVRVIVTSYRPTYDWYGELTGNGPNHRQRYYKGQANQNYGGVQDTQADPWEMQIFCGRCGDSVYWHDGEELGKHQNWNIVFIFRKFFEQLRNWNSLKWLKLNELWNKIEKNPRDILHHKSAHSSLGVSLQFIIFLPGAKARCDVVTL